MFFWTKDFLLTQWMDVNWDWVGSTEFYGMKKQAKDTPEVLGGEGIRLGLKFRCWIANRWLWLVMGNKCIKCFNKATIKTSKQSSFLFF
jgi:hypothetical protein